MKRILTALILTVFLAASFSIPAFAADDGVSTAKAGITPDSPLYKIDLALEKFEDAFTSGDLAKAKKMLKHAEERLAEAQKMVEENKITLAEDTAKRYSEQVAAANDRVQSAIKNDEQKKNDGSQMDPKLEELIKSYTHDSDVLYKNSLSVLSKLLTKTS
jgi:transcriptional regulator with AAA-type ATPase domain